MINNICAESYNGIGIYKISNDVDNKVYIGSSKNCSKRILQHKKSFKRLTCNKKFKEDVQKGVHFNFKIIWTPQDKISWFDLYEMESHYIQIFDSIHNGYNIAPTTATSCDELLKSLISDLEIYKSKKEKMIKQSIDYELSLIMKRTEIIE